MIALANMCWTGEEQVESTCEFVIEPFGFIKYWETLEWPNECGPVE
jgi:hypothetical protein